jgi:hypothetical protein
MEYLVTWKNILPYMDKTIFLDQIFLMRNKMDELSNERWQQNCCEKLNKRNKME